MPSKPTTFSRERKISSTAWRCEVFSSGWRSSVEMRTRGENGIAVVAPIAFLHPDNDLTLHAYHRCGRVAFTSANMRDFAELPSLNPALELLSDSGIRSFSHVARPSDGPLRLHLRPQQMVLTMFAR